MIDGLIFECMWRIYTYMMSSCISLTFNRMFCNKMHLLQRIAQISILSSNIHPERSLVIKYTVWSRSQESLVIQLD